MNGSVIDQLLKFRPFARFYLVTVTGLEYEVKRPDVCRVYPGAGFVVWSEDGTTDFVDLDLIERVRMDDDFGFAEVERIFGK